MADEARLSAVPNRAKTFRRSFVSFPLEALEEGSSPAMVSHILNLFIHVCCKFRTSMDDLENKSWFWFCMEAGKEHCSMAFPASFLGKSVYCGRWSKYSHFINVSKILKTNLNQVFSNSKHSSIKFPSILNYLWKVLLPSAIFESNEFRCAYWKGTNVVFQGAQSCVSCNWLFRPELFYCYIGQSQVNPNGLHKQSRYRLFLCNRIRPYPCSCGRFHTFGR